jgi:hypothetical protein
MQKRIFAIALSVLVLATIASAADDPFVGTWKLNVAKSQSGMMLTGWKSGTVKVESQEGRVKYTTDYYFDNGTTMHNEAAFNRDGGDYPLTTNLPSLFDSISSRKIDANTVQDVYKLEGKEVMRHQWVLSKDGKTATVTTKYTGLGSTGSTVNQVLVLERQ